MGMSYFIAFLEKILLKIDLLRYREVADGNLPRPARLTTRKRRVSVLSPIRALSLFKWKQQTIEFAIF
jgi:hypothetical protein